LLLLNGELIYFNPTPLTPGCRFLFVVFPTPFSPQNGKENFKKNLTIVHLKKKHPKGNDDNSNTLSFRNQNLSKLSA
jgi:hypothetical protein